MAISFSLSDGVMVGVENVWPLVLLPIAIVALFFLVLRNSNTIRSASSRSRRLLFVSRVVIIIMLVVAAMGPYTVAVRETSGDPQVTMLVDRSDSMAPYTDVTEDVVGDIEENGVPVTTATVGTGQNSRLGDGIVANLQQNGTVVIVSDGQVTEGRNLQVVSETAQSLNATVSMINVQPNRTERAVSIDGPDTATVGLPTEFTVSVRGVDADEPVPVEVMIDGEIVTTDTLSKGERLSVTHTFEQRSDQRVTARIDSEDIYERNNVFYHSVRVVEKPDLLYVSNQEYPLQTYLTSLYNVTKVSSVSDNLAVDEYAAVVIQNLPADRLGNVSSLQSYVVSGGGLVVVGGENAYESGGYEGSSIASLLPVQIGEATGGTSNIVLVVDVSKSTQDDLSTQKAIALDVLDQLGDQNKVGVVAFDRQSYRVAELQRLSENRGVVSNRIRRLRPGQGTDIPGALQGADEVLGDKQGNIILLSDGWVRNPSRAVVLARQLGEDGHRIYTVGATDRVADVTMTRIAEATGGSYYPADDRSRLQLLFGGTSRQFDGEQLTIATPGTFITSGVELTATPGQANDVSVKSGAEYQVATADGTPAIASWRFGLGRVVSVTSYGQDGGLDGLLTDPDSLVVTKSVNFAVGDPSRSSEGVTRIGNARVGEQTSLTYRGEQRPSAADISFRQVGERTYRGEFIPDQPGYNDVLGRTYAANYPIEYGRLGQNPSLAGVIDRTNGRVYSPDEGESIARLAREQSTQVRTVRNEWNWLALLIALLLFTGEVILRRIQVYQGKTSLESGLR